VLEKLADELHERGLHCTFAPGAPTGEHVLEVTNRRAYLMNERIMCTSGWYWWSCAERSAPVADAPRAGGPGRQGAGRRRAVSRLEGVIAARLDACGLHVRPYTTRDDEVTDLEVTNPQLPALGRVIIDHEGLLTWERWGRMEDDAGAGEISDMIIGVLGGDEQPAEGCHGKLQAVPSAGDGAGLRQ
jgi:hypothetical protein